jgi:serine-type D-Ala-D-Ala carboxypeptidase
MLRHAAFTLALFFLAAPLAFGEELPWKTPPALKPGDTIAIVAPAYPVNPTRLQTYVKQLEAAGYKVRLTPGIETRKSGFLSGTDEQRAAELNAAFRDPTVRGVFAARGGYGLTRILDKLDYDALRADPKVVTGYSDLTALHLAIAAKARVVSFHSPMPLSNLDKTEPLYTYANDSFRRTVFADRYPRGEVGYTIPLPADKPAPTKLVGGTVRGRLVGGNLSLIVATIGTPYAIQPKGAILFLEDVDEPPYRIDRYLSQLRLAGVLDQVAGVVLGQFTPPEKGGKPDDGPETQRVLREYFGSLKVPVLANFPVGHVPHNVTLPHGALAELDADKGTLKILENPVTLSADAPLVGGKDAPKDPVVKEAADLPAVTAKEWAIADGKTGKILWHSTTTEKRPIASTTKIMTALLVLELAVKDNKVLNEIVTFSEKAAKTPGSSAKLRTGEKLPAKELLYGLMLPSGNDAAVALAEHFGSRFPGKEGEAPAARFIAEMNRRAKSLGMTDTSYLDPNGLSRGCQSTASDLSRLAHHAYKNEAFRGYVKTRSHRCEVTGPDGTKRTVTWTNTNRLLTEKEYDGVKTGTTTPAGACLVASGHQGGEHLFVVILGSTSADRYKDAHTLFKWAWTKRGVKVEAKPLEGAVILVDPGHGGQGYSRSYTGGTRGTTSKLTESELNLRVALALADELEAQGATVFLTRHENHRLSREGSSRADELHARIDFIDHRNPHFFLSVHHNAGGRTATGHTALYKNNAKDDALYQALAQDVNEALGVAVPGPTNKLIKGDYHILRETAVPGTISEAGYMTSAEFDALCNKPEFPQAEAAAIARGAIHYWTAHKAELISLREKLAKDRAAHPRDPKTYTAIDLNPEYRDRMNKVLARIAPDEKYDPIHIQEYVQAFKAAVVTDPKATFDVKAEHHDGRVTLTGTVSERKYHDQLIDVLVAMKVCAIDNEIRFARQGTRKLDAIDTAVRSALDEGACPGAVVLVLHKDEVVYRKAFGLRAKEPEAVPMTVDTVFDLASLTKPVATATAIWQLAERGKLKLTDPVAKYWPDFGANGKEAVTIEQCLLHTSGLINDNPLRDYAGGREKGLAQVAALKLEAAPGTRFQYSDVGFIALGEVVERVGGKPLDVFVRENVYGPLKLIDTGFRPTGKVLERVAPTGKRDGKVIHGVVHDPRAYLLGGVAGDAGLFGTADDLARYIRMVLHGGELDGVRILSAESVKLFTTPVEIPAGPAAKPSTQKLQRTRGWDVDTAYSYQRGTVFTPGTGFGHTGFTGTSIWVDPPTRTAVIVLTNRVHPDDKGNVKPLRIQIATIVGQALKDAGPSTP